MKTELKIGDKIKVKYTYKDFPTYWRKGVIIEFSDEKPGRTRVKWDGMNNRTWFSNSKIEIDN